MLPNWLCLINEINYNCRNHPQKGSELTRTLPLTLLALKGKIEKLVLEPKCFLRQIFHLYCVTKVAGV